MLLETGPPFCVRRSLQWLLFFCRVSYYANSDRSFNLKRLILSGDICVNPGPEQCSVSSKTVARNHRAVSCDKCDSWCHLKCGNVLRKEYQTFLQMESFDWICPPCCSTTLPLSNICYNIDHGRHVNMDRKNCNAHKGVKCFLANARSLKNKVQDLHALYSQSDLIYLLSLKSGLIPAFWTTK